MSDDLHSTQREVIFRMRKELDIAEERVRVMDSAVKKLEETQHKDYTNPQVQMQVLREYMLVMIALKDWHGVSDVANDLREIEARTYGKHSG